MIVENRAINFEVAAGYTVEASSAAIAFLWSHWHVLYAFRPERVRASVTFDERQFRQASALEGSRWHARGFGGEGDWWLERAEIGVQRGRFTYFTMAKCLGIPIQAKTVMEYERVNDSRISYQGTGIAALPKKYRPFHPILRLLGSRITVHINQIGGQVAELITREPQLVAKTVNEDAFQTYQAFMDEERRIRGGKKGSFKIFTTENSSPVGPSDDIGHLVRMLERIELLLQSLSSRIAWIDDYRASLSVFSQDHKLALVKNRMIVSRIVEIIYNKEVGENRRKLSLAERLLELRQKSLNVPETILGIMGLVDNLGDEASRDSFGGLFDSSLYAISFQSTLQITEWFFVEYLAKGAAVDNC